MHYLFGDCAQPPLPRLGLGGRSEWAHSGYLEQRRVLELALCASVVITGNVLSGPGYLEQPLGGTGAISLQKTNSERRSVLFNTVSD